MRRRILALVFGLLVPLLAGCASGPQRVQVELDADVRALVADLGDAVGARTVGQGRVAHDLRQLFGGQVDADPSDNQVLTYDAATGTWGAEAAAGGGTDLSGLGADNRLPRWDGTDTLQSSGVTLDDSDNLLWDMTRVSSAKVYVANGGKIGWTPFGTLTKNSTPDLQLSRDGAGLLRVVDPSGAANAEVRAYDSGGTKYGALSHNGMNATLNASSGRIQIAGSPRTDILASGGIEAYVQGDGIRWIRPVQADTSDQSLFRTSNTVNSQELRTNRGASTTVTDTLPTAGDKTGYEVMFVRIATQAFRVDPGDGQTFTNTDGSTTTSGKYKELGSDGALLHVLWDGSSWLILNERGTVTDEA